MARKDPIIHDKLLAYINTQQNLDQNFDQKNSKKGTSLTLLPQIIAIHFSEAFLMEIISEADQQQA